MFSRLISKGRNSPPPQPPAYAAAASTPSTQLDHRQDYVGSTATIQHGAIVVGPGNGIYDAGNFGGRTCCHGSVSVTGDQTVLVGNAYRPYRSVSPVPTYIKDSPIVKFEMTEVGVRVEGSGSPSAGTLVPKGSKQEVKLGGGKTMVFSPDGDRQSVTVVALGYRPFSLYFDSVRDVMMFAPACEPAIELDDGAFHAVTCDITVQRKADVVIVRYFDADASRD